jgi:hypothetical protein
MENVTINRQDLYNLIWSEPMSVLIKKYNTSYGKIRKICEKMNIPIPANGHWSKIQFGKSVLIENLSDDYSGKNDVTFTVRQENSEYQDKSPKESIEEDSSSPFRVPERLSNPDILITSTKNYYDAVRSFDWRSGGSYPSHENVLSFDVSKDSLPRALRIMDTIIKLLRARNHDIKFKYGKTCAVVEGEDIEIKLKEKNRVSDVKTQYGSRQLESTGKFVFIIGDYHKKEVGDGIELIETKLAIILAKLEAEGKREKEERIANEAWHRQWEEQQRIEKEIRERKENDARAFKELFIQASRLHQANILRDYIQTVEARAIKTGNISVDMQCWINWAKEKVEWYDPLINKEDPLLNDNYKTSLFKEFLKEWQ